SASRIENSVPVRLFMFGPFAACVATTVASADFCPPVVGLATSLAYAPECVARLFVPSGGACVLPRPGRSGRVDTPCISHSVSWADGQISWGKTRDLRPIYLLQLRPLVRMTLGFDLPSGLAHQRSPLCTSCASGQGFAYSFLPTLPCGRGTVP